MVLTVSKEIYCPYCNRIVKTSMVSWGWVLITLLTGYIIVYLLYCAFNDSRICKGCNRRIYEMRLKDETKL